MLALKLRRIAELSIILLFFVMLIVASYAQMTSYKSISSSGVIKRLPWLRVEGQWIVDEYGRRIQLRGAGCDYYAYGRITTWLPTYINWMKQTGCNVMRLAFCVPGHRVAQTEYDPEKMDYVLNLLEQNGLYAVLDCHHYWATEEVQGWDDVLPKYKQDWINCWVNIANRYKNRSVIAMYELCNEPYGSGGEELRNAYYECIDAIRATGDNHIICCSIPERTFIYEADGEPTILTWSSPSQIRPNMCLNLHNWHSYNPDDWFKDDETKTYNVAELVASEWLATATYYREKLGCPIVLGEFGTYNYDLTHPNVREMQLKIQMAEQLGIPWWTWILDEWIKSAPTYWINFVKQKLGGAFASSYLPADIPTYQGFDVHTFPALPFNIWTRINETLSSPYLRGDWNRWGVCFVGLTEGKNVVFTGPCLLRVQEWGNNTRPFWGIITKDYYVNLTEGQTQTIRPTEGFTMIYAWED